MAHPGILHAYTPRLVAFEHAPKGTTTDSKPNTLLWIGGLGDGLLGVHYASAIAASLPSSWTVAEVLLSSSYKGWATGSLKRDARELGECVKYFKKLRPGAKVVLMGHSTGCQDVMEYLVGEGKEGREGIDGGILQAGVSDREAWDAISATDEEMKRQLKDIISRAKKLIDHGKEKEILSRDGNPLVDTLGAPVSAYRAYSLLAVGGDDDYFSSDLPDPTLSKTFGNIPKSTPVMFLWGDEDPYVPASVDKETILKRWTDLVRAGGGVVDDKNGGVVKGAHHNLNDDPEEVVQDLVGRVVGFLKQLDKRDYRGGDGTRARLVPRRDVSALLQRHAFVTRGAMKLAEQIIDMEESDLNSCSASVNEIPSSLPIEHEHMSSISNEALTLTAQHLRPSTWLQSMKDSKHSEPSTQQSDFPALREVGERLATLKRPAADQSPADIEISPDTHGGRHGKRGGEKKRQKKLEENENTLGDELENGTDKKKSETWEEMLVEMGLGDVDPIAANEKWRAVRGERRRLRKG